ncbi:MAG: AI-2E family transporter [Anaerolineae bacterium]|nr:MAG: AI-2E family transporter [Anaerolineae bacterium]
MTTFPPTYPNNHRPQWSPQTKLVVSVLMLFFGVYLLYQFRALLPPLILAIVLAYAVSPIAVFLQSRLRLPRGLAILLGDIIFFAILLSLPAIVLPPLASQVAALNLDLQRLLEVIDSALRHDIPLGPFVLHLPSLVGQVPLAFDQMLQPVLGQTLSLAAEALSSVVWIIFILVVSFYLMKDFAIFDIWIEEHVPPLYQEDYRRLRMEIHRIWGAFFRGQLTLALVVSVIFTAIGFIVGLPFALSMGILAGLLEFLPSIGHGIWLTLAVIMALLFGSTWLPIPNWAFALLIIGLHIAFQQFDLNYLIPRIIGRSVHLPPLVVILGIVAGAIAAGVLGIPLAAPAIATLRVLGRYIYARLFDLDPFPHSVAPPLPPPDPQWYRRLSSTHWLNRLAQKYGRQSRTSE